MIANFFWFFSLEVFVTSCANRPSALSFGSWGQVFAAIGPGGLALRSAIREKFRLYIFEPKIEFEILKKRVFPLPPIGRPRDPARSLDMTQTKRMAQLSALCDP